MLAVFLNILTLMFCNKLQRNALNDPSESDVLKIFSSAAASEAAESSLQFDEKKYL